MAKGVLEENTELEDDSKFIELLKEVKKSYDIQTNPYYFSSEFVCEGYILFTMYKGKPFFNIEECECKINEVEEKIKSSKVIIDKLKSLEKHEKNIKTIACMLSKKYKVSNDYVIARAFLFVSYVHCNHSKKRSLCKKYKEVFSDKKVPGKSKQKTITI